jgi:glycosyltransferase involved in cell wall biosynthesis
MKVHANQVIENNNSTRSLQRRCLFTADNNHLSGKDAVWQILIAQKDSESDQSIAKDEIKPKSNEPLDAVSQQIDKSRVVHVLLLAEACNPGWSSVPLVGYNQARALAERNDLRITLVTHERNRENLERDELMKLVKEVVFINSDAIARPFYLLGKILRGGKSLGWTTNMAMALPGYLYFERLVWKRFRKELQTGGFNLIHRLTPVSPTMPSSLAGWTPIPMVIGPINGGLAWPNEHPEIKSGEREWLAPLRNAYRYMPFQRSMRLRSAAIIAGSRSTADEMKNVPENRLHFLPENGFDMDLVKHFDSLDSKRTVADRFGLKLISVARLVPYKAIDIALEALSECRNSWKSWTIVGEGPMGNLLAKRVEELGLADRVHFTGWLKQSEVVRHLIDNDLLIQPSLREFGGGAVLEAMACGTVPLIVDYGGPSELVAEGCGIKVPMTGRENLRKSLTEAVIQIGDAPEKLAAMSQKAQSHVKMNLTWKAKAAWLVKLYRNVIRKENANLISNSIHPAIPVSLSDIARPEKVTMEPAQTKLHSAKPKRVGYIGVNVLNNATICNEAAGLLASGVPLAIATVKDFDRSLFNEGLDELAAVRASMISFGAISQGRKIADVVIAPLHYPIRFWHMVVAAIATPCEGLRQKSALLWQIIPAIVIVSQWRRMGYEIGHLHAHWAHTAAGVAQHASRLLGVGFSMTGHANDLFVHQVALKSKIRNARFIHAISEYHRRFYLDQGALSARLPVVYCGIDTHRFDSSIYRHPSTRFKNFVAVGRLVEKKGFHHLIEACLYLRDRGHTFHCLIAGSGPDEHRLRTLVELYGLKNQVHISGDHVSQEKLPQLLGSFRFMVLPCVKDRDGDMDGLPQVLMESMACGRPVISTKLVGIPDLVRNEVDGLLVPTEDVHALVDAIERMLTNDLLVDQMGQSASEYVRQYFDRDSNVARVAALFQWALDTPGHTAPPSSLLWPAAPGAAIAHKQMLMDHPSGLLEPKCR